MKTTARREADEIRAAARREAELIVREAELRGEKGVEAARAEEASIRVDIQALKRIRRQLVEDMDATLDRYRRLLGAERGRGRRGVVSERLLRVRVQPRAPRSEIVGWRADGTLSVRVAAPPVEGQANAALTTLLARALRVPPSAVTVVHGHPRP